MYVHTLLSQGHSDLCAENTLEDSVYPSLSSELESLFFGITVPEQNENSAFASTMSTRRYYTFSVLGQMRTKYRTRPSFKNFTAPASKI
jgi:hypothetical protein